MIRLRKERPNEAGKSVVVAISLGENKLRAVELVRRGTDFELVWSRSRQGGASDMASFAAECRSVPGSAPGAAAGDVPVTVTGFESTGAVFHHLNVPAAKKDDMSAMIKLQAESRMPLPVEKMEVAWRTGKIRDGQVSVTVAGAKTEQLKRYADSVRPIKPARILLDCEGIVKAWRVLFAGTDEPAVVVSVGMRSTYVCLAENGAMMNMVSLDVGMDDFVSPEQPLLESATPERFTQDMRSVLELFGYPEPAAVRVLVLSDGGAVLSEMVHCLQAAGLQASTALPQPEKLTAANALGVEDIYQYRVPLGLALAALDGDFEGIDLFEGLCAHAGKTERRPWFYSFKAAVAAAVVALILVLGGFFAADVVSEKRLDELTGSPQFQQLFEKRSLVRMVARERADLLELLSEINSIEGGGIMLDSFRFAKGQPVSISGEAPDAEKLYKFHETLVAKKGIRDVKMTSSKQAKGDKLNFTVNFHYKHFSRKNRGLAERTAAWRK